jgi:hypothetical protein
MSRNGFFKGDLLSGMRDSCGCSLLKVFVNLRELLSFDPSDGRFLGFGDGADRRRLASTRLFTADLVGEGGVK